MFKKNLTLLSIVNIYIKLTSLAIVPFIARRFTIEEFGVLAMAQSILGYASDCFDGGVKKVAIRELSKSAANAFEAIIRHIFSIRILMLSLAFLFMNLVGAIFFSGTEHRIIIGIISFSLLIQMMDVTWIYDAKQEMKFTCLSKFIERSVFLIGAILGIYLINIKLLAFSFPLSVVVAVFVIWFFVKDFNIQLLPFRIEINYIKEGLIIGFSGIAASLCLTIDQFMITHYMGAYALGLYSAATKLFFAILTFLWAYSYALFPRLSKSFLDKEETRRILSKHTIGLGTLGTATVATLCLFSSPIIRIFFSEKFLTILPVFKILNIFMIISFFNILFSDSLNAFHMQKVRFHIIVQALVLNVLFNIFFIPRFGLLGAVYASIIAQLFIFALSYFHIRRTFQLKMDWIILGFFVINLILVKLSL